MSTLGDAAQLRLTVNVVAQWRVFLLHKRRERRAVAFHRRRRLREGVQVLQTRVAARKSSLETHAYARARINYVRQRLWFARWVSAWRDTQRVHRREAMAAKFFSIRLLNKFFAKLSLHRLVCRRKAEMKRLADEHWAGRRVAGCWATWRRCYKRDTDDRRNEANALIHFQTRIERRVLHAWRAHCGLSAVEKQGLEFALEVARVNVSRHFFRRWKQFAAGSEQRRVRVLRGLHWAGKAKARRAWTVWRAHGAWMQRVQAQLARLTPFRLDRGVCVAFRQWVAYSEERRLQILKNMRCLHSHKRYMLAHAFEYWQRFKAQRVRQRFVLARLAGHVQAAKYAQRQRYVIYKTWKRATRRRGMRALLRGAQAGQDRRQRRLQAVTSDRTRLKRLGLRLWLVHHRRTIECTHQLALADAWCARKLKARVFNHTVLLLHGRVRDAILARRATSFKRRRVLQQWRAFTARRVLHKEQRETATMHARVRLLLDAVTGWRGVCERSASTRRTLEAQREAQAEYAASRDNHALLATGFQHWHARYTQLVHVRDRLASALTHSNSSLLRRMLRRWDAMAYRLRQRRARAMERLAPIEVQVKRTRTHPFFLKWRVATYFASQAAARAVVADAHWARQQQKRVVCTWRQTTTVARKRKQLLAGAEHLRRLQIAHRCFTGWRKAYAARSIALHKEYCALMLWKRTLCAKAWGVWRVQHQEAVHRQRRVQRALEAHRGQMRREGLLRWFAFALRQRAERGQTALARQQAELNRVWTRVARIAQHWRRVAARRAQSRVADALGSPIRHGGLREPHVLASPLSPPMMGTKSPTDTLFASPRPLAHHIQVSSSSSFSQGGNIPANISIEDRCASQAIYKLLEEATQLPALARPHVPLDILLDRAAADASVAALGAAAAAEQAPDAQGGVHSPVMPLAVRRMVQEQAAESSKEEKENALLSQQGVTHCGVADASHHQDEGEEEEEEEEEKEISAIERELLRFQTICVDLEAAKHRGDHARAEQLAEARDARRPHLQQLHARLHALSLASIVQLV